MKKAIIGAILCSCMLSSVALASPLNDFSKGKTAIDISVQPNSDFDGTSNANEKANFDAKSFVNYGVTVGLGNNFAVQYNGANMKSKNWQKANPDFADGTCEVKSQELNLLYKIDKNFTVFTGFHQAKPTINYYNVEPIGPYYEGDGEGDNGNEIARDVSFKGDTSNNWQVGLIAQTELSKKLTGYAVASTSKDINYWKIGLGYALNKDLDANVFYSKSDYNNLKFDDNARADFEIKGIGYGITYKFN